MFTSYMHYNGQKLTLKKCVNASEELVFKGLITSNHHFQANGPGTSIIEVQSVQRQINLCLCMKTKTLIILLPDLMCMHDIKLNLLLSM